MKTDSEIYKWIDTQVPDPVIDADGEKLYYRQHVFEMLKDFVVFNGVAIPAPEVQTKTLFERLVAGEIAINMQGDENWGNRVQKLYALLKAAAPKDTSEPRFTFSSFYYIDGDRWYASEFLAERYAYDPLQIEIHE